MLNQKQLDALKAEYQSLKAKCLKIDQHSSDYRTAFNRRREILQQVIASGLDANEALIELNSYVEETKG